MSLREEKQRRQRTFILENSIALFRSRGFERVRVRDIAATCLLSEATFFNYFSNKEAVLREWAERAFAPSAAATSARAPLRRTVRAWTAELARKAAEDPEMMRAAWPRIRLADLADPGPVGRGRAPRSGAATDLIAEAQARGEVRSDLDARSMALLLQAGLATALAAGLAAPDPPGDGSLQNRLARAADLLLDGFRKRNERVRPPAPGGDTGAPPSSGA
jgi:AcrR family transcriptional regulator